MTFTPGYHPPELRATLISLGRSQALIATDDAWVANVIEDVFAALGAQNHEPASSGAATDEATTTTYFSIERDGDSTFALVENGGRIRETQRLSTVLRSLASRVNILAAENPQHPANLHAAGFVVHGSAVVAAAPRGTGKTTLVTEMCRRGFGYLSDELIGVDAVGRVYSFPKPLNIKEGQFRRQPDLATMTIIDPWRLEHSDPDDLLPLIPAHRLGARPLDPQHGVPAGLVVLLDRCEGQHEPTWTEMSPAAALVALAANVFDLGMGGHRPEASLFALAHLAAAAPTVTLHYSSSEQAADALEDAASWPTQEPCVAPRLLPPRRTTHGSKGAPEPETSAIGISFGEEVVFYVPTTREILRTPWLAETVWHLARDSQAGTNHLVDRVVALGVQRQDATDAVTYLRERSILV